MTAELESKKRTLNKKLLMLSVGIIGLGIVGIAVATLSLWNTTQHSQIVINATAANLTTTLGFSDFNIPNTSSEQTITQQFGIVNYNNYSNDVSVSWIVNVVNTTKGCDYVNDTTTTMRDGAIVLTNPMNISIDKNSTKVITSTTTVKKYACPQIVNIDLYASMV